MQYLESDFRLIKSAIPVNLVLFPSNMIVNYEKNYSFYELIKSIFCFSPSFRDLHSLHNFVYINALHNCYTLKNSNNQYKHMYYIIKIILKLYKIKYNI